jgi:glycosyltransferase involved in cell wall biosynthesis
MSESLPTVALIPAFNAASTLAAVIEVARSSLPVVVIDDGSTDRTGEVATTLGATVLRHPANRGKGAALTTGFAWAMERELDGVVTLDADGQHLASEIPRFLAARVETGGDLIIGSRRHLFDGMLPRRRLANRFSAWGISWAAGVPVADSQSGFRFYSTRLLRQVRLRSTGFDMESEVIVSAARQGLKIVTIPIDLGFVDGLATSHYRPFTDSLRIAWTVFKTRFM